MLSFNDILTKYANRDNIHGTDKNTTHSYGELYSKLFLDMKNKNVVKKILEIGVFSGASVVTFADYFENAEVFGADINLSRVIFGKDNDRIKYFKVDATKDESVTIFKNEKFDIILDDASHLPEDQVKTLDLFAPLLSKNGLYIIEDISDQNDLDALKANLLNVASNHGLVLEWYDMRKLKGRYDDIVAVFNKK